MALQLTAFNIGTQTFSVCANRSSLIWNNIKDSYGEYVIDSTNLPLVEYSNCVGTFQWGVSDYCTSAINVSAVIRDSLAVRLCAYLPSDPINTSAIIELTPSYAFIQLDRLDDQSLSAVASYQQVSTLVFSGLPPNYGLTWTMEPSTTTLSAFYNGNIHSFAAPLINAAWNVSSIFLSASETNPNSYALSLSVFGHPFNDTQYISSINVAQENIELNSPIQVNNLETFENRILLSAFQYDTGLDGQILLNWDITPTNGITLSAMNQATTLPLNTETSAVCADYVAFITTVFTDNYVYTLSSYTGTVTGNFRPYIDLTSGLTLTALTSTIVNNQLNHQYYVQIHGVSGGVPYNLNELDYVLWLNTSNNGLIGRKIDNTLYDFTLSAIEPVANIDNLYLDIYPTVTTDYPRLCTYSFTVCALSGSDETDSVLTTNFTITAMEWLDSSLLTPEFVIQYEPTNHITVYRSLTSGSYRINYEDSIVPPNSEGYFVFTFNDAVSTVPYSLMGSSSIVDPFIYHTLNGSSPCLCTLNLTVYASAAGYNDYVSRAATTKYIRFTDFPVASTFVVYPEFSWTGTNWTTAVESQATDSGTILLPNVSLSAYALCHTENFFVSSQSMSGTSYKWDIQCLDNTDSTSTLFTTNTGWIPKASPVGTSTYSVCAAIFNAVLPATMPTTYYETIDGQLYPNFSTTYQTPTSTNRKHIDYFGITEVGLIPVITNIEPSPAGVPSNLYVSGSPVYQTGSNDSPFDFQIGLFKFEVRTAYGSVTSNSLLTDEVSVSRNIFIDVDDIGDSYLAVPKYDVNTIEINPILAATPSLKVPHPSANDWCFNSSSDTTTETSVVSVDVYPMVPLIYTPNRYVLTGTNVSFENLANCFSGVQDFVWTDRDNDLTVTTCVPYTTTYDAVGPHDISLTTHFSAFEEVVELFNEFNNVINVQAQYDTFNSDITRIYGVTVLSLPNDPTIGTNDWITADNFNACMQKLSNNLTYLQNMAQLYDVPPTEFYGWLGSRSYSNSSKHFRWYVNSPNISYGYNEPYLAVADTFHDLQDVFVRDNIMYVANSTAISVLSSDFRATLLGSMNYKTIGDSFTNVKAIQLDSSGHIYVLDGNRIITYTFDATSGSWMLLYDWGGYGGPNARNKFNNPNDFYIDQLDNVWVADTANNVIKEYSRSGSWLKTITSPLFDNHSPLSVTLDENRNIYALTTSSIVKFDSLGTFLEETSLNETGALKIRECKDNGYAYILYANKVVKHMYSPATDQAAFANDLSNYTYDYRNVYHDEFRNLYVVANNHILKYVDKLTVISLTQDIGGQIWTEEDLFVDKDEYQQDWVYNRCLNRMWDNCEAFRRSILGKFDYRTIMSSTSSTILSSVANSIPADFDFCNYDFLYQNGQYVTTEQIFTYEKPCIRSFTVDEYKQLPYTKDEIYIGINEFVSSPVLNRPIQKLLECQETILEMLS